MSVYVSAEEAVSLIKSGNRIFSHGSACTPNFLIDELARQSSRLRDIEFVSITQQGNVKSQNLNTKTIFILIHFSFQHQFVRRSILNVAILFLFF
jgi:acyl CoA:acetate/3-ketoacid CoA transferase alpha subunit